MAKIKTFRKSTKSTLAGAETSRHLLKQGLNKKFHSGANHVSLAEVLKREKALMLKELAI